MILAIDLGGTYTKISCLKKNALPGRIVSFETIKVAHSPKSFLSYLSKALKQLEVTPESIANIHICAHGTVKSNKIIASTRLPKFINYDFKEILGVKFKRLQNDAVAAAVGSHLHFSKEIKYPALVLTLGTGVGVAVIKNKNEIKAAPDLADNKIKHNASSQNAHQILGAKARENLTLKANPKNIDQYTLLAFKVLQSIQKKYSQKFKTIILLGGATHFLDGNKLQKLTQKRKTITSNILIDPENQSKIILRGVASGKKYKKVS